MLPWLVVSAASAQDFARYSELTATASEEFAELSDDSTDEARASAVEAAELVVAWLIAFEASPEFADLPADQQASVLTDRHRWDYNIARQALSIGDCAAAQERIAAVLENGVRDPELLPRVSALFAEATTCANASRYGTLSIDAEPSDAQVRIDGVAFGTAQTSHHVELGPHELTLSADGFEDFVTDFELTEPDQELSLGPFELSPVAPIVVEIPEPVTPEPLPERDSTTASNIMLASAGALGATGLGLIVAGQRHQRLANNPGEGQELIDPAREERVVRNFRIAGVTSLVAAAALGTTGIVIRPSRDSAVSATPVAGPHFAGIVVHIR